MNPMDYLRSAPRADDLRASMEHRASRAREAMMDAGSAAAERGERLLEATEEFARREPVKALGIAMAVGALAVLILTSKWPTGRYER